MKLPLPVCDFFTKQKSRNHTPGSSEKVKSSLCSTTSSLKTNIKLGSSNPKSASAPIQDMLDPIISTSTVPKGDMERWALGTMHKMVLQGVNKCINNLKAHSKV